MNKIGIMTKIGTLATAASLFLAACGGGGGGGVQSVTYTGSTSPAAINDGNKEEIAVGGYEGGDIGTGLAGVAPISPAGVVQVGIPVPTDHESRPLSLKKTLENAVAKAQQPASAPSSVKLAGAVYQRSDVIPGTCVDNPGSASYTFSFNDQTGSFSGNMTFNNYCEEGDVLNGNMAFSQEINVNDGVMTTSVSINALTVVSAGYSYSTSGSITSVEPVGSYPVETTMNMVLKDNSSGKTYWVKDYNIIENLNDIEISGTYYDHDHGYVVVATTTPISKTISDVTGYPVSGVMTFTGSGGAKVQLTFTGTSPGYQLLITPGT